MRKENQPQSRQSSEESHKDHKRDEQDDKNEIFQSTHDCYSVPLFSVSIASLDVKGSNMSTLAA